MAITEFMEHLRGQAASPRLAPELSGDDRGGLWSGMKLPTTPQVFTGLDIGTTKVCAIIGEISPAGQVTIKGVASTPSQGLRRGVVVNLEETISSIRTAMRKAEEIAQLSVSDVFVGIAGGHIRCHQATAEVEVQNPERGVSRLDIRRVTERAVSGFATPEREIIDRIPQRFYIDDGWIVDPENFASRRLGVEVLVVTAAVTSAQNIVRAVEDAGYRAAGIYLEPLASSLAVLNRRERELGVVLIDIGGGTSDIAVWADDVVRYTDVVPYGGDAVTEDIHKGLRIPRSVAENLKKRPGYCVASKIDPSEMLEVQTALTGETERVPRQFLAEIIECRMEEILEMCREKVEASPAAELVRGGIVLTGGASLTPGIVELAGRVFRKPCKVAYPTGMAGLSGVAASPIYSTGVGLVLYGLVHERDRAIYDMGGWQRMLNWFRDLGRLFRR